MPATREPDFQLVPEGFISVTEAARVIGCRPEFLLNRRWVRRQGLPAYQLRRGFPVFYDKDKLHEWVTARARMLKPEKRNDGKPRPRSGSRHTKQKT